VGGSDICDSRFADRLFSGRLSRPAAYTLLFIGLVLVSTSGPFIVLAHMDAYAVVLWRAAGAAVLFLGYAAARGLLKVEWQHVPRIVLGAVLLGTHFLLWVKAFDLTDYASNLLLLVAQPVMAAVLGIPLGDRPTRHIWISIALASIGLISITGGDFKLGPRALAGDGMCVLGGLAIALFYAVTRAARAATPLPAFMGLVMSVVAAVALPVVAWAGGPVVRYPARSWGWLSALVVLTTVGGHGLLNLVARHVKLYTVNLIIVLEPAIAIALGALLFGAGVRPLQVAGGVLLGAAVVVGLRHERS